MSEGSRPRMLDGRVAIVTGGGRGIGEATALRMAEEGARLAIVDLNEDNAKSVATAIAAQGGQAIALKADVSEESDIKAMTDATLDAYGRIDVLHNNAAMLSSHDPTKDLTVVDAEVEYWDRMFAVNVRGVMLACKHVIPHMKSGGGAIVNTTSVDAFMGDLARTAYGASKAAVTAMTMSVATQFAQDRIRCNAVAPGLTLSPIVAKRWEQDMDQMSAHFPLGPADPSKLASAVVFLASDEAASITGVTLRVDGGLLAHAPWYAENRSRT